MGFTLENVTLGMETIQLQSGHRIKVLEIERLQNGTFLAQATQQIAGLLGYRDVSKVQLKYDARGRLLSLSYL